MSTFSHLPLAQNHPYAKVTFPGVTYFDPFQRLYSEINWALVKGGKDRFYSALLQEQKDAENTTELSSKHGRDGWRFGPASREGLSSNRMLEMGLLVNYRSVLCTMSEAGKSKIEVLADSVCGASHTWSWMASAHCVLTHGWGKGALSNLF